MDKLKNIFFEEEEDEEVVEEPKKEKQEKEVVIKKVEIPKRNRVEEYQANEEEKIDYVKKLINQIMKKEITKPEWMKYIEMNASCNEYDQAPSTFLQIIPKENQYEALAQRLIEFLYSPNLTITMLKA